MLALAPISNKFFSRLPNNSWYAIYYIFDLHLRMLAG
jgi:hypothetical protein